MKICAIICEFNPFHNGHKYLIDRVRADGRFDGVLCVMSGHFTQRGDRAVLDKFTRARHAVTGGADCVAELPAPFAVAPAPVFARGAIKLAASVPDVCAVAFGCESEQDFYAAARAAENEDETFRRRLSAGLESGESYARSYGDALAGICGADISTPNNILALEYAKAAAKYRPELALVPVKRIGASHRASTLDGIYASASAIRAHLGDERTAESVPPFVLADLSRDDTAGARWEAIVKYALAAADEDGLNKIYGCGDGLANRLKKLQRLPAEDIISQATTKRYPSSRIRRALTANALRLTAAETNRLVDESGYIKPLAVRSAIADEMLKSLAASPFPLVITGEDAGRLTGPDALLHARSRFADSVWCAAAGRDVYDCTILKI